MITLTSLPAEVEHDDNTTAAAAASTACYSVTIFTQRWKEVRDFYVDILSAQILSERTVRQCEHGEMVSYFHLYVSMKSRESVLNELRRRGIIVTSVGPYTNFRDPEGRVIKLSDEKTIVA